MKMMLPIIEDVTKWTLSEICDTALEIKIKKNKVLAHIGYKEITDQEYDALFREANPGCVSSNLKSNGAHQHTQGWFL